MNEPEFDPHSVEVRPAPPTDEPIADADFETLCAHYAEDRGRHGGAAALPIYQTSTFIYPDAEAWEQREQPDSPYFEYTRVGNPTTAVLEAKLARLERGEWAYVFGSGMGAISAAINACVYSGAHVVATGGVYWPTNRYLRHYLPRFGVETTFVDTVATEAFIDALRPSTQLVYLESPTSGYFDILDIGAITTVCRERGIATIFDNSWATPVFQNPLELGCDLVVHSATKYIGGHSDVVAGAAIGRDDDLRRRVFRELELLGAVSDPFASWLLLRGLRTLKIRMRQHEESALKVAAFLDSHDAVRRVHCPGIASHPRHELAQRQQSGHSGLFSFELADQSREATNRFMDRLKLFGIGVSWGGYESLVVGGTLYSKDLGQPTWLIRLSAGLEATDDLIADVKQALEA